MDDPVVIPNKFEENTIRLRRAKMMRKKKMIVKEEVEEGRRVLVWELWEVRWVSGLLVSSWRE